MCGDLIGLVQAVRGIVWKIRSGFARRAQMRPVVPVLRPVIAVEEPVQRVCIRAARVCKRGNEGFEQIVLRFKSGGASPAAEPEHIGCCSRPAEVGVRGGLPFRDLREFLFRVNEVDIREVEIAVLQRTGRQLCLHLLQRRFCQAGQENFPRIVDGKRGLVKAGTAETRAAVRTRHGGPVLYGKAGGNDGHQQTSVIVELIGGDRGGICSDPGALLVQNTGFFIDGACYIRDSGHKAGCRLGLHRSERGFRRGKRLHAEQKQQRGEQTTA